MWLGFLFSILLIYYSFFWHFYFLSRLLFIIYFTVFFKWPQRSINNHAIQAELRNLYCIIEVNCSVWTGEVKFFTYTQAKDIESQLHTFHCPMHFHFIVFLQNFAGVPPDIAHVTQTGFGVSMLRHSFSVHFSMRVVIATPIFSLCCNFGGMLKIIILLEDPAWTEFYLSG